MEVVNAIIVMESVILMLKVILLTVNAIYATAPENAVAAKDRDTSKIVWKYYVSYLTH